jgi:type II secretory pathway component GspD/PulD (secretin)
MRHWFGPRIGRLLGTALVVAGCSLMADRARCQSPSWYSQSPPADRPAAAGAAIGDATFRAYPLRQVGAETAQRQLAEFFASTPGAEVVADAPRNRVLVRGTQQVHQVAAQLLTKLDQPPTTAPAAPVPSPPAQQLESYPLTPATRDALERLQNQWRFNPASAGELRVALDERTGQALVLAPQTAHQQIRTQLAQAGPGPQFDPRSQNLNGGSAENNPQSAIRIPQSNQHQPTATDPRLQLRNLTTDELHGRLEKLLSRPLAVSTDNTGGWHSFVLEAAAGTGVTVSMNPATGELHLAGPAASTSAWRTVITALDGGPATDGGVTQLVATNPASHERVRQVLDVVQTQQIESPRPSGTLMSMLMQPGGTGAAPAQTNQPAVGGEDAPARAPDAQTAIDAANLAQAAGELLGPVDIQYVEGLDVIILRGNDRDVERVMQIINQIEQLSAITVPVIEVYTLQNVDSRALGALLTRLYAQVLAQRIGTVSITPLGKPNALLLVGRAENVRMAIELIQRLDQPVMPTTRFEIFPLKHASATEAKALIDDFFEQGEAAEEQAADELPTLAPKAMVVADARTNSLVVSAGPRDLAEIAALVARIDSPSGVAVDQVRVFQIRNAVATEMADVLRDAIQAQGATAGQDDTAPGARPSALEFRQIGGDPQQSLTSGVLSGARISADARANSIIVTAPADSMELIAALIAQLDQSPNVAAELKVFTLENGDAVGLTDTLRTLFGAEDAQQQQAVGGVGAGGLVRMQFSFDERTNSIIAAGTREDLAVVEAILLRLDGGDIRERITVVYRLKNAFAQNVSDALNNWLQTQRTAESEADLAISPFEQIEREVIIVPELASNSLVVSATPRYYKDIESLIEQLDERPPMVMIQVLIAEVRLNDTDEFGLELGLQDSLLFDRSLLGELSTVTTTTQQTGAGGAVTSTTQENIVNAPLNPGFNFNNQPLGNNGSTSALATAANVAAQGLSNFSVGRVNNELGFGGFVFSASSSSVSVLLRALQEKRRLEVLSRPQIMALDGQVGIVQVGQQVPRITLASINEFGQTNSIQYVPVGLILRVQPRISPDGLVVMQIYAEKSEVGAEAEGIPISISANGNILRTPRIDSTQAETTVSALSGQTVVLSGLLTNRRQDIHRRVPLIADIPLIGDLFRYDLVSEERKELLIILTPRIIHNKLDAEILKQVESSRMSWILSDVVNLHGEAGLRSRTDEWCDAETEAVYPTYIPQEGELLPAGSETMTPVPGPVLGTPDGTAAPLASPFASLEFGYDETQPPRVEQANYVAPARLPQTNTSR